MAPVLPGSLAALRQQQIYHAGEDIYTPAEQTGAANRLIP